MKNSSSIKDWIMSSKFYDAFFVYRNLIVY